MIRIAAHWLSNARGRRWRCADVCQSDPEKAKRYNCHGRNPKPRPLPVIAGNPVDFSDLVIRECPNSSIDPEIWAVVEIWHHSKKYGSLPHPGAVLDQDSWIMEALAIMDSEIDRIINSRRKAARNG